MINRLFDDNGNNDRGEDIQTVGLAEHARRDADYVLTLEEIGESGRRRRKARRDSDERGRVDRQTICHRRLFGISAGAGPRQSGAGRDARPAP